MNTLCPHVTLDIDKKERIVTVTRGAILPYFGWSRKLQADTPRLKCSECGKYVKIRGYIVKRDRAAMYTPRIQEAPRGKTATRVKASKKDTRTIGGETWGFVE